MKTGGYKHQNYLSFAWIYIRSIKRANVRGRSSKTRLKSSLPHQKGRHRSQRLPQTHRNRPQNLQVRTTRGRYQTKAWIPSSRAQDSVKGIPRQRRTLPRGHRRNPLELNLSRNQRKKPGQYARPHEVQRRIRASYLRLHVQWGQKDVEEYPGRGGLEHC